MNINQIKFIDVIIAPISRCYLNNDKLVLNHKPVLGEEIKLEKSYIKVIDINESSISFEMDNTLLMTK